MSVKSSGAKSCIKRWARRLVAETSHLAGAAAGGGLTKGLRILTYHRIARDPRDPFALATPDFIRQMEILSGTGAVQRLDHALREMASGDGSQGRITVTFDDGTHDFITDALPVMVRLQLPATLYVSPARIGTVGFLQWDEVLEISRAGVTIGSHGLDHRSLGSLDAAELWRQVSDSRKQLEDRLGLSVESLAYPYGTMRDFNENVKVQVRKAGYRAACSSINGVNTTPTDLYALHRTKIEQGDDPIFRKILAGGLDGWEVVDRHLSFLQNRYA